MFERDHPLRSQAEATVQFNGVSLHPVPPLTRLAVRAGPEAAVEVGDIFGLALPVVPCSTSASVDRVALWLGPDEWLVVAEEMPDWPGTELAASIVDVSHAITGIAVWGSRAAEAINAYCALDLHPSAFPPGMCTRSVFAKVQIILWRTDAEVFRIEVTRSSARYVWDLLGEACREFLD